MRDRPGDARRSPSTDDPADRLRQASLRVTKQRIAVLRVLERHPHSDAGFVAQAVREEMGAVSTQAIYGILAALGDAGIVGKIEPASLPALFELRTDEDHHHVVCRECKAVADVGCAAAHQPFSTPPDGFVIDQTEVTFWGLCASCETRTGTRQGNPLPPTTREK